MTPIVIGYLVQSMGSFNGAMVSVSLNAPDVLVSYVLIIGFSLPIHGTRLLIEPLRCFAIGHKALFELLNITSMQGWHLDDQELQRSY